MFIEKIKSEEKNNNNWVEKVVPIFIFYIITITVIYAFHTVLCFLGIIKPEAIVQEWVSYNVSLGIQVIIIIGVIHLISIFLPKKLVIVSRVSAFLSGLCGVWFLHHIDGEGWHSGIGSENIEELLYFTAFAALGFALFIAVVYACRGMAKIKSSLIKILIIILPLFLITFLILINYISFRKSIISCRYELIYKMSLFRGKYAAMRDIKNGNASILGYGLRNFSSTNYDRRTGLKIRAIAGCVVGPDIIGYAKAYNNYIDEYIAKFGPPKNSKRKYSNIILKPVNYMYSNMDGKAVFLKRDAVAHSSDGSSSVTFPHGSRYGELINKGKKFKLFFLYSKNPSFEIKWGPKGSDLLFVRVNPHKEKPKVLNDYILIYVIDVHDGARLNVIKDKFVEIWEKTFGKRK